MSSELKPSDRAKLEDVIVMSDIRPYVSEPTKQELFMKKHGGMLRDIFCTPLSILFGFLSFACRFIGKLSSVLIFAGIYYGYKTYAAVKAGDGLLYGNYIVLCLVFVLFPFIAMALSYLMDALKNRLNS